MNHYSNILFDLDGTLIDTKPGVIGSLKKVFVELSLPLPPENRLNGFMGPPLEQCFTQVCGLDRKTTEKAVSIFRRYYGEFGVLGASAYQGISELLAQLKDAGYSLGVATSKNEKFSITILKRCGICGYFDSVAGAPDSIEVPWGKEDSISKAMDGIKGALPENTVIVGDRKFDAAGAKKVGIDSIGVLFGYGEEEEIRASSFSAVAADIGELKALLL